MILFYIFYLQICLVALFAGFKLIDVIRDLNTKDKK